MRDTTALILPNTHIFKHIYVHTYACVVIIFTLTECLQQTILTRKHFTYNNNNTYIHTYISYCYGFKLPLTTHTNYTRALYNCFVMLPAIFVMFFVALKCVCGWWGELDFLFMQVCCCFFVLMIIFRHVKSCSQLITVFGNYVVVNWFMVYTNTAIKRIQWLQSCRV